MQSLSRQHDHYVHVEVMGSFVATRDSSLQIEKLLFPAVGCVYVPFKELLEGHFKYIIMPGANYFLSKVGQSISSLVICQLPPINRINEAIFNCALAVDCPFTTRPVLFY